MGYTGGKQNAFIDVSKGLAEQFDADLLPAGPLLTLSNGYYDEIGEIRQRPGFSALGTAFGVGLSAVTAQSLTPLSCAAFGAGLIMLNGCGSYPLTGYSPDAGRWSPPAYTKANLVVDVQRFPVAADSNNGTDPSVATDGAGTRCTVWKESGTGTATVVVKAIIEADGVVLNSFSVSVTSTRPRVLYANGYFWITYVASTTMKIVRISATTAAVESTLGTVSSEAASDLSLSGTTLRILADKNGTQISYFQWNTSTNASVSTTTLSTPGNIAIAWLIDPTGLGYTQFATIDGIQGVTVYALNTALGTTVSNVWVVSATAAARNVTGYVFSDGGEAWRIVYDETPGSSRDRLFYAKHASGVTTVTSWLRNANLMSKVAYRSGQYFFVATQGSAIANNYVIYELPSGGISGYPRLRGPQAEFSRLASQRWTNLRGGIGEIVAGESGSYYVALSRQTRIATDGESLYDVTLGIDVMRLTFNQRRQSPVNAGGILVAPGGTPRFWDGSTYAEVGFPYYPDELGTIVVSGSGAMDQVGTVNYVACYRYIDYSGRVWRSAPTPTPKAATIAANQTASVPIPSLHATGRYQPDATADIGSVAGAYMGSIYVELYREDESGVYRLVDSKLNDTGADTTSVVDNLTILQLAANEPLYTTGGVIANDGPPASIGGTLHNSRYILVDSEVRTRLWATKPIVPGKGLEFSEVLTYEIPEAIEICAVISTDDKLFVFSKGGVFALFGDFSNNLGVGATLQHSRITTIPVTNPRAIVAFEGIWFESQGKIWRISRGLEVQAQEAIKDSITSFQDAFYLGERNQIWFCGSTKIGVYDTIRGLWSTYTTTQLGGCNLNGSAVMMRTGYDHWKQDNAQTKDPSGNIILSVATPWLALGGRNAEWRLHEFIVFGRALANFILSIENQYDYLTTTSETDLITNPFDPMRIKVRPDKRKTESWRVVVSSSYNNGVDSTAAFTLKGIGLSFTVRGNLKRGTQVAVKASGGG